MHKTAVTILLCLTATACVTSTPTDTPGVTIEGHRLMWFEGPEVTVEVYYGMIEDRLGEPEAVLRVGLAGVRGTVDIQRTAIRLFDPSGRAMSPLDQPAFRGVQGRLRTVLDRYAAWWGPTTRFLASRGRCDRWFIYPSIGTGEGFVGSRHAFDSVFASSFRVCGGPLVFSVPGGAQPGRWVLQIDLEESTARIPFEVEVPES
jgi:hypothetical protein